MRTLAVIPVLMSCLLSAAGQFVQLPRTNEPFSVNSRSSAPTTRTGAQYRIGQDDLIDVSVFEIPELTSSARVSAAGTIDVPLIGSVDAGGKTTTELAKAIGAKLRSGYVNDPQVTVFVREYASQPVSVIGAVKQPGIYQIKGEKNLLDVLAMAYGLDLNYGKFIKVIRPAPNDDAVQGAKNEQVFSISVEALLQEGQTDLNIPIRAGDTINVLMPGSIFVVGEVFKPGEFVLRNGKDVTVTQAVALGGGTNRDAKKKECLIIRYAKDGSRKEIPVDLQAILSGTQPDTMMTSNDILFVPASKVKSGMTKALDSVLNIAIGRAIYVR